MNKVKQLFKKPAAWIITAAVVVCVAAAITTAVALSAKKPDAPAGTIPVSSPSADKSENESVSDDHIEVSTAVSNDETASEIADTANSNADYTTNPQANNSQNPPDNTAESSDESYVFIPAEAVENWRFEGIYPNGVPVLTEEQVKAVTPDMTWRQVYESFGLDKAFENGIAFGVENNRLLLLDWDNADDACEATGDELLSECLDLWREKLEDGGRFVTFSDAVGMIFYDPDKDKIFFGDYTFPTGETGMTYYYPDTGKIVSDNASKAELPIYDERNNQLKRADIKSGSQGYAVFSKIITFDDSYKEFITDGNNGLLWGSSIDKLILID